MYIENKEEVKVPPLHGKDLVKQKRKVGLIEKCLLCLAQGITTGKWEWKIQIKF